MGTWVREVARVLICEVVSWLYLLIKKFSIVHLKFTSFSLDLIQA